MKDIDPTPPSAEMGAAACQCLHSLLPAMEPACVELIRRHDLGGVPHSEIAKGLGIMPKN
jgi:DNA-directed RNA polymerase specialized sigma24 family protein